MSNSTIWEILDAAEKRYGSEEAVRYRVSKDGVEAKIYTQLKQDSDHFSSVLRELGELGNHIAITGMTSYTWITAFLGVTGSGCVAVPLDVSLPAQPMLRCWCWMRSAVMWASWCGSDVRRSVMFSLCRKKKRREGWSPSGSW